MLDNPLEKISSSDRRAAALPKLENRRPCAAAETARIRERFVLHRVLHDGRATEAELYYVGVEPIAIRCYVGTLTRHSAGPRTVASNFTFPDRR